MAFTVLLTDGALQDLDDIYNYIYDYDSPQNANYVLEKIEDVFNSLAELPDRGGYPKELLGLGIREFREIFFKPYRIIYRISEEKIIIMLISDGRRDMRSLLQSRLLNYNL